MGAVIIGISRAWTEPIERSLMRSARRIAALNVGHMLLVPVEEMEDSVLTRVEMLDGLIDETICKVGVAWNSSVSMAVWSNAACYSRKLTQGFHAFCPFPCAPLVWAFPFPFFWGAFDKLP